MRQRTQLELSEGRKHVNIELKTDMRKIVENNTCMSHSHKQTQSI